MHDLAQQHYLHIPLCGKASLSFSCSDSLAKLLRIGIGTESRLRLNFELEGTDCSEGSLSQEGPCQDALEKGYSARSLPMQIHLGLDQS